MGFSAWDYFRIFTGQGSGRDLNGDLSPCGAWAWGSQKPPTDGRFCRGYGAGLQVTGLQAGAWGGDMGGSNGRGRQVTQGAGKTPKNPQVGRQVTGGVLKKNQFRIGGCVA